MKKFANNVYMQLLDETAKMQKLVKELEQLRESLEDPRYTNEYKSEKLSEKLTEIKKEREAMKSRLAPLFDKELSSIESRYSLNPGDLTDDLKLLEMGIVTERELETIIERNAGNYTMMQAIEKFVNDYNKVNPSNAYRVSVPHYATSRHQETNAVEGVRSITENYLNKYIDGADPVRILDRFFAPVFEAAAEFPEE